MNKASRIERALKRTAFLKKVKSWLATILILGAILGIAWMLRPTEKMPDKFAVSVKDIEQKYIDQPQFVGYTPQGNSFTVMAEEGRQMGDGKILLDKIQASVEMESQEKLSLFAKQATLDDPFHMKKIGLSGMVRLVYEGGHEMNVESAEGNMESGSIFSHATVHGTSPLGSLRADGFTFDMKTRVLTFTGHVKIVLANKGSR